MRACCITIRHFRGIQSATIYLPEHAVLIGDNNTGKTTVLEALDLALGPDRLNHRPPINEHDFFRGKYLPEQPPPIGPHDHAAPTDDANQAQALRDPEVTVNINVPKIEIEVTITDLSCEQKARFGNYVEFWDSALEMIYVEPDPSGIDSGYVTDALRVTFCGWYDPEEDDFEGRTYFSRTLTEDKKPTIFTKRDKQTCGFLYLRSLRTGTRALSLERGSLLDIILRLKDVRPQMWEDTIDNLAKFSFADDSDHGISGILKTIDTALTNYVPKEWGVEPHLKVSNLTRDHLRSIITVFIATGGGTHAAPYYRQGTGTINMLVLAMLSEIAAAKQNIIFAMEEPETSIPPYAQKRIVHELRKISSQAIFTSHSPYVLEEFKIEETVALCRDDSGDLARMPIALPHNVKLKRYRQQFRTRFCEGLLARRVLIAEGATEASAFPVACRKLAEFDPQTYSSLEALGICVVDADGDTNVPGMAKLYQGLGKSTSALCDKQSDSNGKLIRQQVDILLMHEYKTFEELVLAGTTHLALKRFIAQLEWPKSLAKKYPDPSGNPEKALRDYFLHSKGNWGVADFFAQCSEDEIPEAVRDMCIKLKCKYGSTRSDENTVDADGATSAHPKATSDAAD